jgi:hypothetical protein
VYEPAKRIPLPEGRFRLLSYAASKKDASDGGVWRLNAAGVDLSPLVAIAAGGKATLALGEPFVTEIQATREQDSRVVMQLRTHGMAGESVGSVEREFSNGRKDSPEKPQYRVTKDGKQVASGSFEYG